MQPLSSNGAPIFNLLGFTNAMNSLAGMPPNGYAYQYQYGPGGYSYNFNNNGQTVAGTVPMIPGTVPPVPGTWPMMPGAMPMVPGALPMAPPIIPNVLPGIANLGNNLASVGNNIANAMNNLSNNLATSNFATSNFASSTGSTNLIQMNGQTYETRGGVLYVNGRKTSLNTGNSLNFYQVNGQISINGVPMNQIVFV